MWALRTDREILLWVFLSFVFLSLRNITKTLWESLIRLKTFSFFFILRTRTIPLTSSATVQTQKSTQAQGTRTCLSLHLLHTWTWLISAFKSTPSGKKTINHPPDKGRHLIFFCILFWQHLRHMTLMFVFDTCPFFFLSSCLFFPPPCLLFSFRVFPGHLTKNNYSQKVNKNVR